MASANLFIDKSNPNKDGLYPVCIRICHMRKQWPVGLKVYATIKDYEKALSDKGTLTEAQKLLRGGLIEKRKKAQAILDGLDIITKDTFKHAFFNEVDIVKISSLLDMESQFKSYIDELRNQEQISTVRMYEYALEQFLKYKPNPNLQDIDKSYLQGFENWIKNEGGTLSTASIHLRCLRRIFNRCIKSKKLNSKHYPFEDFVPYAGRKSKDVLYPAQVEQFLKYEPKTEAGHRAKAFWFFSFLANGMNPKDIMSLKYSNLKGDMLSFIRQKTSRTRKEAEEITLFLHPYAEDVIKNYGNPKKGDCYIFPLFNDCKTEADRFEVLKEWKRQQNKILGRMAKHMGLDKLNLGLARHSMATSLAMKNISINVISGMLGHSRLTTTQHYIKSIPDEAMRKINHDMLDFGRTQLKAV